MASFLVVFWVPKLAAEWRQLAFKDLTLWLRLSIERKKWVIATISYPPCWLFLTFEATLRRKRCIFNSSAIDESKLKPFCYHHFPKKILESPIKKLWNFFFENLISPIFPEQILRITSSVKYILFWFSFEVQIILFWPIFARMRCIQKKYFRFFMELS